MAFLCPVRMRRDKKKATNANIERDLPILGLNLGRITGSSSIETLVRVGIEKEHGLSADSKMLVLHDFSPCVDDELEVKRGQIVNILYRENDWVYVISQDSRQEGFIPFSYIAPFNSTQLDIISHKKKLPREPNLNQNECLINENMPLLAASTDKPEHMEDVHQIKTNLVEGHIYTEADCTPFHKEQLGRYLVFFTFIAREENDISVERGEFVTLLNREDPDWFWIMRNDGQEGFIPASFVYSADSVLETQTQKLLGVNNKPVTNNLESLQQQQINIATDDLRYGTELVMLYDYKAQAPDDLSVRRGDWIYADLNNQTVDGWLWAYSPKTRKYGFLPKSYARPPAMTSL